MRRRDDDQHFDAELVALAVMQALLGYVSEAVCPQAPPASGPGRTDDFSQAMNRIPKLVATRTRIDLSAWQNSSPMSGELLDTVEETKAGRDVIIAGGASIVHALTDRDRVDEYRILYFLTVLGTGTPVLPKAAPVQLRLLSAEASGPAILARYERFAK